MSIRSEVAQILRRSIGLAKMARSVERHLLEDQAEAVAPRAAGGNNARAGGISDPTGSAIVGAGPGDEVRSALAPFAKWTNMIAGRLGRINRELDELEREFQTVLSESGRLLRGEHVAAAERCPGWSAELQAQLGGCGKHLETYRRTATGEDVPRATMLCVGCRKAKERAEREEQVA